MSQVETIRIEIEQKKEICNVINEKDGEKIYDYLKNKKI